jgi:hypothetical protein
VNPLAKLSAVFADKQTAATAGAPGAMVKNAPMVPALAASRLELIKCLPGRIVGREDILPASLRNATIEPVNVMPPTDT